MRHKRLPIRSAASGASGFTIMELIVAMSLALVIMGLATGVFNQTIQTVRLGAATSDMLGGMRTFTDQMQHDFRDMIGPIRPIGTTSSVIATEGGYLVIIQRNTTSWINTPQLTEVSETIADDEIAFICFRGQREPICPSQSNNLSNSSKAAYVRIWYGHGLRTLADGTYDGTCTLGSAASGPGHLANRWILGRQALFLNGADGVGGSVYAKGVAPTSFLSQAGYGPINPAKFYMGLTDISDASLADLNANNAFNPVDLTFASNRLCVNPVPYYDSSNPQYQYCSWQVAQGHGAFLANVSDFQVWYALPTDATGVWHRDTSGNPTVLSWKPSDSGNWPSMIRLRWRMHDGQVRIGQAREAGRWYEQIIRVRRD